MSFGQDVRRTFFPAESMLAARIAILVPSRYHSIEVRRTYARGLLLYQPAQHNRRLIDARVFRYGGA